MGRLMPSMPPAAADTLQPHGADHRHACASSSLLPVLLLCTIAPFCLLLYLAARLQGAIVKPLLSPFYIAAASAGRKDNQRPLSLHIFIDFKQAKMWSKCRIGAEGLLLCTQLVMNETGSQPFFLSLVNFQRTNGERD